MIPSQDLQRLNRLLQLVYRSLPVYLEYAVPWHRHDDQEAVEALRHAAEDHQETAQRLARFIYDHDGAVDLGEFPLEFTDLHDLDMEYLLPLVVEAERRTIDEMEQIVQQLQSPEAKTLAEEVLGAEKAHQDRFQELLKRPAGAG